MKRRETSGHYDDEIVETNRRLWQMSVARNLHGGLIEVKLSYHRKYSGDKGEYFLTPAEAEEIVAHKDHGFREACERLAASREPDYYEVTG